MSLENNNTGFFEYEGTKCKLQQLYNTEELIAKFGWEEYFIFSLMLLVSLLIGVYFAWKGQNDNAEYMYGGKSMGTLPMTMSLIARYVFNTNLHSLNFNAETVYFCFILFFLYQVSCQQLLCWELHRKYTDLERNTLFWC